MELSELRQEIDRIDAQLVQLFLERLEVTGRVGEYKLRQGLPVLDPEREKRVIASKTALTDDPARKADLAALYENIMAISRRQQRQLIREGDQDPGYAAYAAALAQRRSPVDNPRVVYQGEPGCYSEEAAVGFFGRGVDSRGLAWFPDVFAALERGEADYAVLPVENSSTGSIRQVYDLMAQYRYSIVGEWQVSGKRFPDGLETVTDYIREKGMTPGVWLEPEVMGINCTLARKVPENWFFVRHGKPVYDRSRFQLDYRNPDVRAYMDSVVDRLVRKYNVGYIKMDYNIEPGIGTELHSDSPGDGLLEHERAYLGWLDGLFTRYPGLVIENCASGGLRMDYAMLSRLSIQSTSDTDDYMNYPVIAANAAAAVTPEQAAVWSYPMTRDSWKDEDELCEETAFNMVSSMLLRIHLSGHLAQLDEMRKSLVKEGIEVYKMFRSDIPGALPFWPLGLASYQDEWIAFGLKRNDRAYLAVWKRVAEENTYNAVLKSEKVKTKQIPLPEDLLQAADGDPDIDIRCIYPAALETDYSYCRENHTLVFRTKKKFTARLFRVKVKKKDTQTQET